MAEWEIMMELTDLPECPVPLDDLDGEEAELLRDLPRQP